MNSKNSISWYNYRVNYSSLVGAFFALLLLISPGSMILENNDLVINSIHSKYFYFRGWLLFLYIPVGIWSWLSDHYWGHIQWGLMLISVVSFFVDVPIVYIHWFAIGGSIFWALLFLRISVIICLIWNAFDNESLPLREDRKFFGLKNPWA